MLSITERQLLAIKNVVSTEASVNARLSIGNNDHLSHEEMRDLVSRLESIIRALDEDAGVRIAILAPRA